MKKVIINILVLTLCYIGNAQIVNIPDANFKAYLVGNNFINTNNDSEIQVSEANAYTDEIYASNLAISSLTGIEAFTALTQLYCDNNNLTNLDVSANTALSFLYCNDNNLTSLDVSNNPNLSTLKCQNNQLTSLNTNVTSLSTLWCQNNSLTSLDISNAYWNYVDCSNNQLISLTTGTGNMSNFESFDARINNLTCIDVDDVGYSTTTWANIDNLVSFSLNCISCTIYIPDTNFKTYLVGNPLININGDGEIQCSEAYAFTGAITAFSLNISDLTGIEHFIHLTTLNCNNNQLTNFDITQNTFLTNLSFQNNQISSLDITQNIALTSLEGRNNILTSLNVTQNTALTYLNCRNNQLVDLDLTLNVGLTLFNCTNNQLIGLDIANGNNINLSSFFATNNPNLTCINVDDASWSTTNWTNIDVTASFSENCDCIVTIPDTNFKNSLLGNLTLNTNNDTEIQCSEASAYTGTLSVSYLSITDLTGIEAFTAITFLYCDNNQLTSLDLTQNTALTFLDCSDNSINTLNITNSTALATLYCSNNSLSALNVTQNTALVVLDCNNNTINTLDLTQNILLETLRCYENSLSSINLNQNIVLRHLYCANNVLTTLNLTQNTALTILGCNDNSLNSLNAANTNNINFSTFNANNNPNLTCIEVDDATWSTANWTDIDAQTSFSVDCNNAQTYVPDDNFEQALIDLGYDTGTLNDYVSTANINSLTSLNVNSKNISDLTGIEDFIALETLICAINTLATLDLSQNTVLTDLRCQDNNLTAINITQNTALTRFWCLDNQLTSLDVSQNVLLDDFSCNNNLLTNLDVTNNTALTVLACRDNQITSLDVSNNNLLEFFSCHTNQLTSLDVSQNSALIRLWCYNNFLTDLNIQNGNNTAIANGNFKANNNINLTCIEVDNATWSTTNWTNIDTQTSFSENCNTASTNDFNLENAFSIYPNPTKNSFKIASDLSISKITIYNHLGKLMLQFNAQEAYDVSPLTDGIYFIQIKSDNKIVQQKLIINSL